MMPKLTETQIADQLATVPMWKLKETAIVRQFQFKDFPGSIQFVNQVAEAAEAARHHPDIDIRWNKVHLVLTTHDEGGLTIKDFKLARSFDTIADCVASDDSPPSQRKGN
jgi:4a-hydroxytetrahydrobiopterin dehydratase